MAASDKLTAMYEVNLTLTMMKPTCKAANCNRNSPANTQNHTAFTESVLEENVSSRRGEEEKGKRHSFSKTLANEIFIKKRELNDKAKHACHETALLKYLANRVRRSKNVVDGKKWFYCKYDELSKPLPYLKGTTPFDLINCLVTLGYVEVGSFNRYKYDDTPWFYVTQEMCDAVEADLIYFDAAVAEDVGISAAVIFGNFEYWVGQCKEQELPIQVRLSPAALARLLPFSVSTIKRGLKDLEGNYIKKLSTSQPVYGLPVVRSRGSYSNENGSYPNDRGSYPNENGSYPNNYTYCKPVSNPLEDGSKGTPTASPSKLPSFGTKQTNEFTTSSDGCITTYADEQDRKDMTHPKSFSPFAEIVPLHEPSTVSMQKEDDHSAFTQNEIIPATEAKWPRVSSLRELHIANTIIADEIDNLPNKHKFLDQLYTIAIKIGSLTMAKLDLNKLDELYDNPDGDEVLKAILPALHQYLDEYPIEQHTMAFNIIYYGVLECMVGAFLWPRDNSDSYTHPITKLISATYQLYLPLWSREEELRVKAVDEEFAQWRHEHASADAHKEDDADLSPAEKMRVFRNALNTKNKVGWIFYDQSHRTNEITGVEAPALRLVQKLFEHNFGLTPSDLLKMMDGCMAAYSKQPAPRPLERYIEYYHVEEQRWHARMGYDLLFFITNLHHIVRQLGLTTNCPVKMFLQDIKAQEKEERELEMAT